MIIRTKKLKISLDEFMRLVGYRKREKCNDWFKPYLSGKFHALPVLGKMIVVHYDIYPSPESKVHFSIKMPLLLSAEKMRILSIIKDKELNEN